MSSSKIFTLEGKALKLNSAQDVEPHIKALKENPDIEEVLLQGNTLGIEACRALGEVLAEKKKLKHANLADIFTGRLREEIPEALSYLLKALLSCPSLHTVNLSDNAFGLLTEKPLVDFLSSHYPLQHLILNNNGLGPFAGTSIANAIASLAEKKAAHPDAPKLETVLCGRNRLETGSMAAWAKAYSAHSDGIKTIRMIQNGIRMEGIETLLTEGLAQCHQLQVMDLEDNTFTIKGGLALSKVLPNWPNLVELGVGECLLGGRGGVVLADTLKEGKNKNIELLRLQYNEIDNKGAVALKDAVKTALPKLKKIELNGNKFSEEDPVVEQFRDIFEERGFGEIDELDEMEEESEDEDEDNKSDEDEENASDDDEDVKKAGSKGDIVKDADEEENENVAPERSKTVDDLADSLKKTSIA